MSDHVIGIVAKISGKPTRNGGTIYNIACDTGGREDEWFGYGFDEPNFQEGDEIEVDIVYKGDYTNVDPKSVNIIAEGDGGGSNNGGGRGNARSGGRDSGRSGGGRSGGSRGGAQSQQRQAPARQQARSKPAAQADTKMSKDDWENKDKMIRRQACMNTSIALIRGDLECGAVALPAKKGDKLDAYIALCDEEAIRLYDQYEEQVYPSKKAAPSRRGGRNTQSDDDYDDDIPQ